MKLRDALGGDVHISTERAERSLGKVVLEYDRPLALRQCAYRAPNATVIDESFEDVSGICGRHRGVRRAGGEWRIQGKDAG